MVDILHKVGLKSASPDDVYQALATIEGLAGWWTRDTLGDSDAGCVLQFRFGVGGFDMKVFELHPAKHVLWQVIDGPQEWIGTKIGFELKQQGDWTIVLLSTRAGRSRWSSCTIALQHQVGGIRAPSAGSW